MFHSLNKLIKMRFVKSICETKRSFSRLAYVSNNNNKIFNSTDNKMSLLENVSSCKCKREYSTGNRHVFNGHTNEPMFEMENKVKLPALSDGEVLVKVRAATICISDIHTVTGARIEPTPSVLGHEACVEIIDHKRCPDQFPLKVGDRATFGIADTCGECEFCTNNLSQKCVKLFKYGHAQISNGSGFNGSYASHIILRKGTTVIKLPEEITDDLGASINCALATMINSVDQIPSNCRKPNNKALVQGDGMLGLYGCALLKEGGFSEIYCLGHQTNRHDLIKRFGAIPVNNDELDELNLTNKIDAVIEVCGSPKVVPQAMKLLKPGGAYIFAGMVHPMSKLEITGEQIIRKCLTIRGVHNYDSVHLYKSVEFLKNTIDKYPYDELVAAKHYKLDELEEAIQMAKLKVYPRVCVLP